MLLKRFREVNCSKNYFTCLLLFIASSVCLVIASSQASASSVNAKKLLSEKKCSLLRTSQSHGITQIKEIFNQNELLQKINCSNSAFGFDERNFWIKFSAREIFPTINKNNKSNYVVEIGYPSLDFVTFYFTDESGITKSLETGDQLSIENRYFRSRTFLLPLNDVDLSNPIYVKTQTAGSVQIPISIQSIEKKYEFDTKKSLFYGIYYGIMLSMILYNLFLFLAIREKSYCYYVAYITIFAVFQFTLNGLSILYLWPKMYWWNTFCVTSLIALMFCFAFLFARNYLKIYTHSKLLDRWTILSIVSTIVIAIASFFLPISKAIPIIVLFSIYAALYLWVLGFYSVLRKFTPAKYFLAAWTAFLLGVVLISLKNYGIVPSSFITDNAMQIGSALEVLLLSMGLGNRVKVAEAEKASATLKAAHLEKESSKHKAIVQTTQMLAHDIRKPFTILSVGLDLISKADFLGKPKLVKRLKNDVSNSMKNVNQMIDDIMNIGSKPNLNLSNCFIEKIILNALEEVYRNTKFSKTKFTYEFGHKSSICVDPLQFQRIFSNIISNAEQAMKGSGTITFKSMDGKEGFLELAIQNTNSFIPAETIGSIFEPFYTKGKKNGTGLGLAIVKKIVNAHGGSVDCLSSIEEGTIFKINIPKSNYQNSSCYFELPADAAEVFENNIKNAASKKIELYNDQNLEKEVITKLLEKDCKLNVMIIEDEHYYFEGLKSYLAEDSVLRDRVNLSYVNKASDARESKHFDQSDLYIVDVDLGSSDSNGLEISSEIKGLNPESVVCIHSNREFNSSEALNESRADIIVPKPMSRVHLLKLINSAVLRSGKP